MTTQFRLFGAVEAHQDGRPLDIGHARQQCVLVALLVDVNRTVPGDQLIDRVWGENATRSARNTLYVYLTRLRRALTAVPGLAIERRTGGYRLALDDQAVDLHRFRSLVTRARTADADEQASRLFEQALGLWRHQPFPGLDTPWLCDVRAALEREHAAAELEHADTALRLGRHAELLPGLLDRAERNPLDERLTGQLMLALHRSGRRAEALARYQRTRTLLAEELGTDPGSRLRELHQRLLYADAGLAAPRAVRPEQAAVPRQLPAAPRSFTGRGSELAALTAALAGRTTVAVAGAGGIGKTWLALHWAHDHLDRFPDGQLFVDLRGFSPDGDPMTPAVAVRGFLDALGVAPAAIPPDPHAQFARYRDLTAGRRMLVVLDNAADSDQVVPLLPGTSSCTVLVTSRRHLTGLVNAHGARHLSVDVLTDAEARTLLVANLGNDRVAAEPETVAELLARCGGYPLALGILISRAHTHPRLSLAGLVAELRDAGLDALDEHDPAASLPAVLSWSHRSLTAPQARVFVLLGRTPGPDIGIPAAACLTDLSPRETTAALRALEQASLLEQTAAGRYRMHDLIRAHAAERARHDLATADREAALHRFIDFHLHTSHAADRLLEPNRPPIDLAPPAPGCRPCPVPDEAAALAWFDAEHHVLLAVQRTAALAGRDQAVWQLAWALNTFHRRRGRLQDDLTAWQAAADAADRLDDHTARSLSHRRLGDAWARIGRHSEALDHLHQALALTDRDPLGQALTHESLSWAWGRHGDDRRAVEHAGHAVRLIQTLDEPVWQWEADALNELAWWEARLGKHDEARTHCHAALDLYRDHDDKTGAAGALDSLGYLDHQTGRHTEAVENYRRSLSLFEEIGNTYGQANITDRIGHPYVALGHPDRARTTWQRALRLYRDQNRDADAERVRRQLDSLDAP